MRANEILECSHVVLNLYYLVGNYGGCTENFNEIFFEIASTPFAVYVLFVQIIWECILTWQNQSQRLLLRTVWWINLPRDVVWRNWSKNMRIFYCDTCKTLLNYLLFCKAAVWAYFSYN